MRADNAAVAYLNGTQIGAQQIADTGNNWAAPGTPFSSSDASLFHAGVNYLSFDLWNNSDVTVNWNWTDSGSGVGPNNCTQSSSSTGEGQNLVITASCTDLAGNTASDSVKVNVDKTAPTIAGSASPALNASGWNDAPVTVSFACADNTGGSGIATDTVAGATLSADGANRSVTSTGDCVDVAGNAAAPATVSGISIDQTPPTLAPTASPPGHSRGKAAMAVLPARPRPGGPASTAR